MAGASASPAPRHCRRDVACARGLATRSTWRGAFLDGGARCCRCAPSTWRRAPLLELCDAVGRALPRPSGAAVIVNDRVDLARLSAGRGRARRAGRSAAGRCPRRARPDADRRLSTHTPAQLDARAARAGELRRHRAGVRHGHQGHRLRCRRPGAGRGRRAPSAPACPLVAIGGITLDTARGGGAAGRHSVAVIADLLAGGDPRARVAS